MFADTADSPFSPGAVREEHGIEFDLVSHMSRDAIRAYDLETDIGDLGFTASRAVYVLDGGAP